MRSFSGSIDEVELFNRVLAHGEIQAIFNQPLYDAPDAPHGFAAIPFSKRTTLPASRGARPRYQLDRKSRAYTDVCKQRAATERINSQAVEPGTLAPAQTAGAVQVSNGRTCATAPPSPTSTP